MVISSAAEEGKELYLVNISDSKDVVFFLQTPAGRPQTVSIMSDLRIKGNCVKALY